MTVFSTLLCIYRYWLTVLVSGVKNSVICLYIVFTFNIITLKFVYLVDLVFSYMRATFEGKMLDNL